MWFEAPLYLGSTNVSQAAHTHFDVVLFKRNGRKCQVLILAREEHSAELVCREKQSCNQKDIHAPTLSMPK